MIFVNLTNMPCVQFDAIFHSEKRPDKLPSTLQGLEASLKNTEYLSGSFSVADVSVVSILAWGITMLGDKVCCCFCPALVDRCMNRCRCFGMGAYD